MRRVIFGAGYVGARAAALAAARGDEVLATVRSAARAAGLEGRGFTVTTAPVLEVAAGLELAGLHAIICFPPDGQTDAQLARLLAGAAAISYVSSTGVYGERSGVVDDTTALPEVATASQARILSAEAAYRAVGATVLRAPGIYGPDRGLHVRVVSGAHRLPGDGSGVMSRIHADDLAALLLASAQVRGETFVVADLEPAPQREVVEWICAEYGCPLPPSVPESEVHESLRRNRRVDGSRALARLGVTLQVPTFRLGMKKTRSLQ